ncbi:UDP-glucose 4-epimerase GalE [Spiribacter roseus]|uniref:UDP-glucose 4-epimerase GalE n=1 Tax=Spiribacter roseus TaxID=1855875 RepID=UPI00132FF954|nr:UDP-glucose 4-epimerase GalE [Spiribacter roseus]
MNILVTGGAGYIGSHACKALAEAGYTPIAYDNLVCGHSWAIKWGPFEEGDIADRARLKEVITKYQPAAVMHFAAYAYVGESVQDPGKYYRNNVAGTLTLLEVIRDSGIDKFIFSSTCATYGIPESVPIREDHPQQPINPYGASKLMIERMLQDFDVAHGLRSISLRYFNAVGADSDGDIGEAHDPETHLIPLMLDAATGKRTAVTVFGDDYHTPDGTCIRDYIHVSDLADAHILALKALEDGAKTTAYNLGNGHGFSVKEVIKTAERVTGKVVPLEIGQRRLGDPSRLVGDSTRIRRKLGWNPRYAELQLMIASAWHWHVSAKKCSEYVWRHE